MSQVYLHRIFLQLVGRKSVVFMFFLNQNSTNYDSHPCQRFLSSKPERKYKYGELILSKIWILENMWKIIRICEKIRIVFFGKIFHSTTNIPKKMRKAIIFVDYLSCKKILDSWKFLHFKKVSSNMWITIIFVIIQTKKFQFLA